MTECTHWQCIQRHNQSFLYLKNSLPQFLYNNILGISNYNYYYIIQEFWEGGLRDMPASGYSYQSRVT